MTENITPEKNNEEIRREEEYNTEAIRLAELLIEASHSFILASEKKAVLLISACIVITGYLLSAKHGMVNVSCESCGFYKVVNFSVEFSRFIALVMFAGSIILGIMVVSIASTWSSGLAPRLTTNHFRIQDSKFGDIKRMHKYLLSSYQKSIIHNKEVSNKKNKKLNYAKNFFILGLMLSFLLVLTDFYIEPITNLFCN